MTGIKDNVAIMGVGCSKFGEMWEKDQEDLLVDAAYEAYGDAGIEREDIEAGWVGVMYSRITGVAGTTAADPLKLYGIPVTRVENYCASGMDAFRNASLSVAAGENDIVLACGVEKLLDEGSSGLPGVTEFGHPVLGGISAPGIFALAANRCFHEYGWTKEDLAKVPVKNHHNGVKHPKAHFRREITVEKVLEAPIIADPLGRYDCCAVSDGAAALVITRPEIAEEYTDNYTVVKANALSVDTDMQMYRPNNDYLGFRVTQDAAEMAYEQAGIEDPRKEIDVAEVHDCFSITEILNYEDLGFCDRGKGVEFIDEGIPEIDGDLPVNPSGGLKCFGHPIGASGCRMLYEITKQLRGDADGYQVDDAEIGLAHNLGGTQAVVSVTVLGMP